MNKVRKSAVAGSFYPGEAKRLSEMIDLFFKNSEEKISEKPFAIVSPHAGYIFSGQIAADAYKQAFKHKYDTIVIMGSNHTVAGFRGVAVYPGAFETPLGVTDYGNETAEEIVNADENFIFNENAHIREHSVEVQIPFIQKLFPRAKIVKTIVGAPDPDLCERFGKTLAELSGEKNILVVASSDLSHFPKYDDAVKVDNETLKSMTTLDTGDFLNALRKNEYKNIGNLATSACGEAPVLTAINASKKSGAQKGVVISYANSGDVEMGDRSRVVGYGAVAFI